MSLDQTSQFLDQHQTCVIATVGTDSLPEAATIGFSHDQNWTFFIGTNNKSRKYANLKSNPKIAMVVGFEPPQTVQIEGLAEEVKADDVQDRIAKHIQKVPGAKKFVEDPGQTWFVIKPTWLRHTNYASDEPIFETKDFS